MSDWHEQARKTYREARVLPEVFAGRCVHSLVGNASCQACVDICPHQAWVIDDEQLGIDAERCDGCDLCVAVCPEGAIQAQISPDLKKHADQTLALFACEPSAVEAGAGVVPCLHAVGLNVLVSLYRQGVRTIAGCSADCSTCPRGEAPRLDALIVRFNVLLGNRQLHELQYLGVSSSEWTTLRIELPLAPSGGPVSRRQFICRTTQAVVEGRSLLGDATGQRTERFEPAGSILPIGSPGQMVPFLPRIEAQRCNACGACLKLCPHEALVFDRSIATYHIEPDRCTGCGICIDLCDQDAVSIQTWAVPEVTNIPLAADRCSDCGITYFMPAANPSTGGRCRICAQRRQQQLLYQVLD